MLTLLPVLVIAITLVVGFLLSRREPEAPRVKRLLGLAFVSVVLLRTAMELLRLPSAHAVAPAVALAGTLAALMLFAALVQLIVSAPYRKGTRNGRFFFAALGLIALSQGSAGGAAALFWISLTRHPWLSVLTTAERFRASLLALVALLALTVGLPPFEELVAASGQPLTVLRMVRIFATIYASYTVLRAFGAFSKDPTLGIRRVSLRLTLSHVLVVTVPLLIVVALWVSSTYLGVNADRALLAGRLVVREGAALEAVTQTALGAATELPGSARLVGDERSAHWPGTRAFAIRSGQVQRVVGAPIEHEERLAAWIARLDSLPHHGVVELSNERWFGAAARRGSDAIVVLAPYQTVLDSTLSPVMDTKLIMPPARQSDETLDSLREQVKGIRDSLPARADRTAAEDSLAFERARAVSRSLGLPDSVLKPGRSGAPLVISTGKDTLRGSGDIGLTGQISVEGIEFEDGQWSTRSFTLRVQASWRSTLVGLFDKVRENPLQAIPIAVLAGVGLLLLPLFGTNLRMVRGMGGSITQAIAALRDGARAFGEGKLAHRIPIAGDDDLWDTARQFNQMAAGLEHARELEKERDRLENELDVARRIQARLLPAGSPDVPGFDVAGRSESAREVGGDYYDHLDLGNGRWLFVIADVSGKGVPAALLMSGFRAALMSQDESRVEPERVASRINDFLHRSVEPGRFVTAFFGFLESASGRFVYVNAGHNPPLLRRSNGASEWLSEGGLILGILSGSVFASGETTLEPDDVLTLYTDGVTEGADATGEQWGEERLVAELESSHVLPASEIAGRLVTTVRGFEGATGPADDLTVLVVKRRPLA
ncbi:MAG: SpoIIE family protein phosphatase [Candidatus Eisenbacteria bacterium]|nr:SpoIIE family protein phosphatase [Candidatus Eisenbacteria bacterium]